MERSSITKWIFIGLAVFLFWTFGKPLIFDGKQSPVQPQVADQSEPPMETRPAEELCTIQGDRYEAVLSTRGASMKHLRLTDDRRPDYRAYGPSRPFVGSQPLGQMDLVTTKNEELPKEQAAAQLAPLGLETRMPLHTDLRVGGADDKVQQVRYDSFDWKLGPHDTKSCTFTYQDEGTALTKTIAATDRPFQLDVTLEVKNTSAPSRRSTASPSSRATWRTKAETQGSLGRQSDFLTETVASTKTKTERQTPSDFEPDAFTNKEFTPREVAPHRGRGQVVAVSSSYLHGEASPSRSRPRRPEPPRRSIEEYWNFRAVGDKTKDPNYGHVYRARLAYPEKELKPARRRRTRSITFTGPKERAAPREARPRHARGHRTSGCSASSARPHRYLYFLKDNLVHSGAGRSA
jgi:YidC/Oxa1 family membrane protein insertase